MEVKLFDVKYGSKVSFTLDNDVVIYSGVFRSGSDASTAIKLVYDVIIARLEMELEKKNEELR